MSRILIAVAMPTAAPAMPIRPAQPALAAQRRTNDTLIRMGVSRKLLTDVMYRQKVIAGQDNKSTRRCLTAEETAKYNVANAR